MSAANIPKTIQWIGGLDGHVALIDQTLLPEELRILECRDLDTLRDAIARLAVRGAPAVGIAAAMGVVLGLRDFQGTDRRQFMHRLHSVRDDLAAVRPTAVVVKPIAFL